MIYTHSTYLATRTVGGCGLSEYILYLIAHLDKVEVVQRIRP